MFKSQGDYEEHGLDGCMASLSLVMNRFQIDLDPKRTTRFALTVGDWFCLLVDTGIEQQDRGAWVIHFLAYQNKVSCFTVRAAPCGLCGIGNWWHVGHVGSYQ